MNQITLQNGQVLTSTALTPVLMDTIFQQLGCQMLGIVSNLAIEGESVINQPQVTLPLGSYNLQVGFQCQSQNLLDNTTVQAIEANGNVLTLTMSFNAIKTGPSIFAFFDPKSNTAVRRSWQIQGSPAFTQLENVVFIRCTEIPSEYQIRDEVISPYEADPTKVLQTRVYSRKWNVFWRARGPNSFDSIRVIKSMLLQDFPHDTLAQSNLYLVPEMGTPVRNPELFEGNWWEQVDLNTEYFEQVTETILLTNVDSVQVIGQDNAGDKFGSTYN